MKVWIAGSRKWDDELPIRRELGKLNAGPDDVLIHGACGWDIGDRDSIQEHRLRGADAIAHRIGEEFGFKWIAPYAADWTKHKRQAGPIRNGRIIIEEEPDLLLAFVLSDRRECPGTLDAICQAASAGIEVRVFGKP